MDLVYKNEKTLFAIAATLATLFWVLLIVGTFGGALIFIGAAFVAYLFAHSGFISRIRGNGIKITESQYPDLYERLVRCCEKTGLRRVPDAYVLRTNSFNALATRFLGRPFVVLFGDVVDALEEQPSALDFYIGHEIGHLHRNHLTRGVWLAPALVLPLLGTAYRRAEEYTCDRYGAVCCEQESDLQAALATIGAGDARWKSFDPKAFMKQAKDTSGFWMSFNELISDYPWLTKRMCAAFAFKRQQAFKPPRRNALAWIPALFVPRFAPGGGMVSLMAAVAIIGIIAAVAIPAYQDYQERVSTTSALREMRPLKAEVERFARQNQAWPATLSELGYSAEAIPGRDGGYEISVYEGGVIAADMGSSSLAQGPGQSASQSEDGPYLVLEPTIQDGRIVWSCFGEGLAEKYLPDACR